MQNSGVFPTEGKTRELAQGLEARGESFETKTERLGQLVQE